jgi:hypothetical protein
MKEETKEKIKIYGVFILVIINIIQASYSYFYMKELFPLFIIEGTALGLCFLALFVFVIIQWYSTRRKKWAY